ncbi:MAG: MarR family transcriptional regulator [Burkholderiaceae bacterium]|jgi:DNA-binding MarR family transcriptional regulator|nr:MarR family transcriptional regulator [Burkholderiaceae bacterium]
MKWDFSQRFGFLVNDVDRLYGEQFDRLARERIGLSRAQCRVLCILAIHGEGQPLSQTELARQVNLSTMAVGSLCERLAAAGWVVRQPCPSDRRANEVRLAPRAREALADALKIGDALNTQALAVLESAERAQLLTILAKVHARLIEMADR